MPYNELRKDYLLNRWVVIATERARRPNEFVKPKNETAKTITCPLCQGNEHMTPPANLAYLPSNGEVCKDKETGQFRFQNWLIRSIPNLYPAFTSPKRPADADHIMESSSFGQAIGNHEVLVESPNHDDHPADAPIRQLIHVINAYKDRLNEMLEEPYVKYVQIFRNHGLDAGASLSHAHSQIIATPFVPPIVQGELEASKKYHDQHGSCIFCDLNVQEAKTDRLVFENEHFVVFAPFASVHPMEFWISPKRHASNFLTLSDIETQAFAKTLQISLKALKDLVNDPAYNYAIHISANKDAIDHYHWHLEVYPKLAIWAGFEKSTGIYINTIPPETAAKELKNTLKL